MTKLTFVGFVGEDAVDTDNLLDNPLCFGWCGGIWETLSWYDYLTSFEDGPVIERLALLHDHIVDNGIRNGGSWHQREGIPTFSDGSFIFLSMRAWGDLMASTWGGHYCDFAWED